MWVKLTRAGDAAGETVYVNLDRFDTVFETVDEDDNPVTRISSCLSNEDGDFATIDVMEKPEAFMGPPKMKVPDDGID